MKRILTLFLVFYTLYNGFVVQAQPETYPVNGVHDQREGAYAFTNATIYTSYNTKIEKATLLIRKGKVVDAGTGVTIPKDAVVIDLKGKHVYPSFIDLYSNYGLPEVPKSNRKWNDKPQMISDKKGAYGWNEAIKPEFNAFESFTTDKKIAEEMRKAGFGSVLTHQTDGIARGSGAVVLLGDNRENELIVKDKASAHYSFSKGNSSQTYPSSLMGTIALLRQTYYDAIWYEQVVGKKKRKAKEDKEYNISLDSWNQLQDLPQIFEVPDRLSVVRADKIGDEFKVQYIIKGTGDEYQRLEAMKATGASFIIPLKFPDAYDVEDPFDALNVALSTMKHWELAPSNPAMMTKAGINIAFTTNGLKSPKDMMGALQKAIKRGLTKEEALKALTYTPAQMLGLEKIVGSLQKGQMANFLVTSTDIFDEKMVLYENWVKGERYLIKTWNDNNLIGNYDLKLGKNTYDLSVKGTPDKPKFTIAINDTTDIKVKHTLNDKRLSLQFDNTKDSLDYKKIGLGFARLSGWVSDDAKSWQGRGQLPNGEWIEWTATVATKKATDKKEEAKKEADKKATDKKEEAKKEADKKKETALGEVTYPFLSYGWTEKPEMATVLFQGATVWTNEKEGILEDTDVLVKGGKVTSVGKGLKAPQGATIIDAKGKHLTCGIIDEHSHIAINRGVNEGSQASSAEVRIGDVLNSDDVNIYRQLSGGVTTAQLLHGSANPIGGQSALIKFRWGYMPEDMKFEGADGFIKFALGENVKQTNWGDHNTVRFPQTRMGVEQVYMDHFTRAVAYGEAMKKSKKTTRRDLELDALLEIVEQQRFITCHSYVQSEITALMRVAEKFDFKVNTFTHILEGYKIADKMKEHGVAGSTFSDWWAYKYEVIDAIPHNGAVLHDMGVLTAFNSDDAEMGRRLNQEAAKAVKYGGLSEEDAWKFVTLNPAKMLHIDNRVGSIKTGKDADLVLWSDNPLSIYAKAEQTYVDGICFYDLEKDLTHRQAIADERNRLIQKMLQEKINGGATQKVQPTKKRHYHCNTLGDEEFVDFHEEEHNDH